MWSSKIYMDTSSESVTCACGSAGWRSNERRFWEVFSREMCALPTDPSRRVWPYVIVQRCFPLRAVISSRVQFYEFVICLLERCIIHIATPHCMSMCSSSNGSSGSPQWEPVYCCKQRLSTVAVVRGGRGVPGLQGRRPPQPGGRDPVTHPSLSQTWI